MFLFPMPMWVLGCIIVSFDAFGALNYRDVSNVAFFAHLGGAVFAYLYFRFGWRVSNWLPSNFSLPKTTNRAKLRIHEPDSGKSDGESDTDRRVDEILKKIQEQGQESLTWRERRILEKASQEYQRKRR